MSYATKCLKLVIAIRRNGEFIYAPAPDETIHEEDVLIVIGDNLN